MDILKKTKKKQISQYLHFRCGMTRLNYSLKSLVKIFKLQKEILKTEMDHDEVDFDKHKDIKDEWLPYIKNDVLSTAFSYAKCCKAIEEITGFSMKDCLSALGLEWKYFNGMRDKKDEPIDTYNDKYRRWFIQQSIKGGRVCAFNHHFKNKICDDVLKISSEGLIVKGNVWDNIEAYMKYKNNLLKIIKEECESKFRYYRDTDEEETNNYINKNIGEFSIHKLSQELTVTDLLWDFDAVSLFPSAMSDPK